MTLGWFYSGTRKENIKKTEPTTHLNISRLTDKLKADFIQ
jgi:hypothetical protein